MEIIAATYQMQFIKWVENEYRYPCLEEQGMKALAYGNSSLASSKDFSICCEGAFKPPGFYLPGSSLSE